MSSGVKKLKFTINGHNKYVNNLIYFEEDDILFSGADDGLIKVWKIQDMIAQERLSFSIPGSLIRSFVPILEDNVLFSNHEDETLRVWDLSQAKVLKTYNDKSFGEGMAIGKDLDCLFTVKKSNIKRWQIL